MTIFKRFTFDSAHFLPNVPPTHKCRAMHGHMYSLTVFLEGEPDERYGWVADFSVVKDIIDPVIRIVDHKLLNEIPGLENPTCELLAAWLWDQIKYGLPSL